MASCGLVEAEDLAWLCRLCGQRLTELDASGYDELDEAMLLAISTACPGLRRLRAVESENMM